MSDDIPTYCIVKIINGPYTDKYGIILQKTNDGAYMVEIDNKEVRLPCDDFSSQECANLSVFDIFSIGLSLNEPEKWIIITPDQRYGVNKEKEFCECTTSSCFNFPSFEAAKEYLSEYYSILQIGLIP